MEIGKADHEECFGFPILGHAVEEVGQRPLEPTSENLQCGETGGAVVPLELRYITLRKISAAQLFLGQPLLETGGANLLSECHEPCLDATTVYPRPSENCRNSLYQQVSSFVK
jgi:hypothetical protein